jgi:hypothetical protein
MTTFARFFFTMTAECAFMQLMLPVTAGTGIMTSRSGGALPNPTQPTEGQALLVSALYNFQQNNFRI